MKRKDQVISVAPVGLECLCQRHQQFPLLFKEGSITFYKLCNLIINEISLLYLPTPSSITLLWNLGSFLGVILFFQIATGVLLSFNYRATFERAIFSSLERRLRRVIRWRHANGASLFFLIVYLHLARGVLFRGIKQGGVWLRGWGLLILLMGRAFLGYVLPVGQMSLWGASVITRIISVFTPEGVLWIWGDYRVARRTILFFYRIHFLLPIGILGVMLFHLLSLHINKSNSPTFSWRKRSPFHPFYRIKDRYDLLLFALFMTLVRASPLYLGDPLNYEEANSLASPLHILPEWYFLWAYAILRGVPSKLGGVLALMLSLIVLMFLPLSKGKRSGIFLLLWGVRALNLLWLGRVPVEAPYDSLSLVFTCLYFLLVPLILL